VEPRDLDRTLRRLASGGWLAGARRFAVSLRAAGHEPGRLLVVGTREDEPWHLTAHLADAARWQGAASLQPVLVRWQVPPGAPPHLSVGVDAVHRARRGTTLLVAAPSTADDCLLERLEDARRGGATVFALHAGSAPLEELAHEALLLPDLGRLPLGQSLDTATHVVSMAGTPEPGRRIRRWWPRPDQDEPVKHGPNG